MNFLMIDGEGDPNTSGWYKAAVEALYAVAHTLKFMIKKGGSAVDYAVMPLEGLWWVEDMTRASFAEARNQVEKNKDLVALPSLRFETYLEGRAAQIMHKGPFAKERPTIDKLHRLIEEQGRERRGKHHEIYLSDPRRTAPERLRTAIRQPFG
jgi:hypothetical protein